MTATDPKRVRMLRGEGDAPEPTTHFLAPGREEPRFIAAAAEAGEKIHYAKTIARHLATGQTIPYALCDAADDLFPDPGKWVLTGEDYKRVVSCEDCKRLMDTDYDPFDEVIG